MNTFFVTKIVDKKSLADLVDVLNTRTQDSYIDDQLMIDSDLWIVRVACSVRGDAGLVRAL